MSSCDPDAFPRSSKNKIYIPECFMWESKPTKFGIGGVFHKALSGDSLCSQTHVMT